MSLQKKLWRRHVPIRTLLDRCRTLNSTNEALLHDVSALSRTGFLKPGGLRFDIAVVIDEASQMRPEEALGSIVRTDQTVVVGDPMQLPPTSFFDRADHFIGTDDDAEEIIDSESILDMALVTYRPARDLRWHYRSRHESLIAFSNSRFFTMTNLLYFLRHLIPTKQNANHNSECSVIL